MCAIIDNNVRHEVFGEPSVQTAAGKFFVEWVNSGRGKLVVGGRLHAELAGYGNFNQWFRQALRLGNAISVPDAAVNAETAALESRRICKSDDAHVLALARVSGARLLFTNDLALRDDFKNRDIIGGTRGVIYSTLKNDQVDDSQVSDVHRDLLIGRRKLCNR